MKDPLTALVWTWISSAARQIVRAHRAWLTLTHTCIDGDPNCKWDALCETCSEHDPW